MSTPKQLKICYVVPKFHPFKGGAEQNIFAMASRMAYFGHDVSVYTSNFKFRDTRPAKYEVYKGIKIYRQQAFIDRPLYMIFIPGLLIKLLKNDFDVIHVSGFGFIWIEFCLSIKKLFSKQTKFINTPHGPFMANSDEKGIRKTAQKVYTKWLSKLVPWLYDKVIAVVPKQTEWMKEMYNISQHQIVIVPNGIESTYLEPEIKTFEKDEKVIITYLNRMEWYKGIQTVLSAINSINKGENIKKSSKDYEPLPEFEFWIMGRPAPFTEKLKKLIQQYGLESQTKFVFTPTDEERDMIFSKKSQINILPSKWEATGIALIEAMAKGNAIITTKQNQAAEFLVNEGENGYTFEFGDYKALAKILRTLLSDYDLRQKMREYNRKYASEFTWESVFPKYEKMINEIVG